MAKGIASILVDKKLVSPEDLKQATVELEKSGESLGAVLVKMGSVSEAQLLQAFAEQLNIPFINLKERSIKPEVIQRMSARLVQHYKVMPVEINNDVLTVALSDPQHMWSLEDLRLHLGCEVRPVLASEKQIHEAITKYYGVGADTIEKILAQKHEAFEEHRQRGRGRLCHQAGGSNPPGGHSTAGYGYPYRTGPKRPCSSLSRGWNPVRYTGVP
jgi:type IV pilus assembly protein PilB